MASFLTIPDSDACDRSISILSFGLAPGTATPWETTSEDGLKQQSAIRLSEYFLNFALPAQSTVALVLSGSGSGGGGSCGTQPSAPSGLTAISESSSAFDLSWIAVSAPATCFVNLARGLCLDATALRPAMCNCGGSPAAVATSTRVSSWLSNHSELENERPVAQLLRLPAYHLPHNDRPTLEQMKRRPQCIQRS